METGTAPGWLAEGVEIDSKYRLGARITAAGRQAVYKTVYRGCDAVIKVVACDSTREASSLKAGYALADQLRHPGLLAVYDFGQEGSRAWILMERGDECLENILNARRLEEDEVRQLLAGLLPALEFLNERQFAPAHLRPTNVFACGERIKLSPDRIVATLDSDSGQLAALILESLTGLRDGGGADGLRSPFREMVRGRWDAARVRRALAGEFEPDPPVATSLQRTEFSLRPGYRKFAGLAIGGALAAAALCALLVRGARDSGSNVHPAGQNVAVVSAPVTGRQTVSPAQGGSAENPPTPRGWAVVGGSFDTAEDAARRARGIHKAHSRISAGVYSASPHFVVLFASGLTEAQAKKQLVRVRRAGAPKGTYVTRFD